MNEEEKVEQEEGLKRFKEQLAEVLKAKGEKPTERNMVKLVFSTWLTCDREGAAYFTVLVSRIIALTLGITDCGDDKLCLDEATALLGEIFLDLSFEQKKAGLTRKENEAAVLAYPVQDLN